mmetsp:Transcript_51635/g.159118  ORF Transcript_51635/g.159118 Transcript_51635/m.159118 type:complete len:645 (-) Transcript_51635:31-1965(-)
MGEQVARVAALGGVVREARHDELRGALRLGGLEEGLELGGDGAARVRGVVVGEEEAAAAVEVAADVLAGAGGDAARDGAQDLHHHGKVLDVHLALDARLALRVHEEVAGEQLVRHAAERPHVGAAVEVGAEEHLGRAVLAGLDEHPALVAQVARLRHVELLARDDLLRDGVRRGARLQEEREAEVSERGDGRAGVALLQRTQLLRLREDAAGAAEALRLARDLGVGGGDEDVLGLQIGVQDIGRLEVRQRLEHRDGDLLDQLQLLLRAAAAALGLELLDDAEHVGAEQRHRHAQVVAVAAARLEAVDEAGDGGRTLKALAHVGEQVALVLGAARDVCAALGDLDGDEGAVEVGALAVEGEPHGAELAPAELGDELVAVVDDVAGGRRHVAALAERLRVLRAAVAPRRGELAQQAARAAGPRQRGAGRRRRVVRRDGDGVRRARGQRRRGGQHWRARALHAHGGGGAGGARAGAGRRGAGGHHHARRRAADGGAEAARCARHAGGREREAAGRRIVLRARDGGRRRHAHEGRRAVEGLLRRGDEAGHARGPGGGGGRGLRRAPRRGAAHEARGRGRLRPARQVAGGRRHLHAAQGVDEVRHALARGDGARPVDRDGRGADADEGRGHDGRVGGVITRSDGGTGVG